MITPNYPLSIETSDEQKFNLIFNDDLFKEKFSKLKSLSLGGIKVTIIFNTIFGEHIKLYKTLERLSLMDEISGEDYEIDRKE